jgi:hypothetical protein
VHANSTAVRVLPSSFTPAATVTAVGATGTAGAPVEVRLPRALIWLSLSHSALSLSCFSHPPR